MQSLSLSHRLEQKLTLRQIQSLEFLTLSNEDVIEKIKASLSTNPTLNVSFPKQDSSYEGYSDNSRQRADKKDSLDESGEYSQGVDDNSNWIEQTLGSFESLHDYLRLQLGCVNAVDENVVKLCDKIITAIDDSGIFTLPLDELVLPSESKYLDQALEVLHNLDPVGIAVSSKLESLVVQSKKLGLDENEEVIFEDMIYNYLADIKKLNYSKIAKKYKVDESLIQEFHELLLGLNPNPCAGFKSEYNNYVIPDLFVKNIDGELQLKLNKDVQPVLTIDTSYLEMKEELGNSKAEKESLKYLNEEIKKAKELIEQVDYRNTTLEKVGKVLLEKQRDFFLHGITALKPLTLEMVANEIDVHLTTVSRISTSKYIETEFGVFPLKLFFSNEIKTDEGSDAISKNAVQEIIRKMIEESSEKLTDQKISDKLKEQGISCARRTVSKYRNALKIGISSLR